MKGSGRDAENRNRSCSGAPAVHTRRENVRLTAHQQLSTADSTGLELSADFTDRRKWGRFPARLSFVPCSRAESRNEGCGEDGIRLSEPASFSADLAQQSHRETDDLR